jgi:hypothetical protein
MIEIICIGSILVGVGGLAFGIYKGVTCAKKNAYIEKENKALEDLNQSLQSTRKSLEAHNSALLKSQAENYQAYEESCVQLANVSQNLNELIQEQQILNQEIENKKAQMLDLTQSIETLSSSAKAAARASFEQYCDALDMEYSLKEREYDELIALLQAVYDAQQDELKKMFTKEARMCKEDLDIIKKELEKIRATREAAMEAQRREEEIKNQATFYTLQIKEADRRDIAYLQSIEFNLREARPLRMLIWSTFYRDRLNDLAARVGAVGACGIYKITHIDSGLSYIGQAKDIKERWVTHVKCSLGIDTPVTSQLYAFTREKGIDNFTFEILEKCSTAELNEKEKFYIDLY